MARNAALAVREDAPAEVVAGPTPGLWDISDAEYYADCEFVSNSMISRFLAYRHDYYEKYILPHAPREGVVVDVEDIPDEEAAEDSTRAMALGTALHAMMLEPARFEDLVIVEPKFNKRSNAGKEEAAAFANEHADKTILTAKEWAKVWAMAAGIRRNRMAMELLSGPGLRESAIRWIDSYTGLWCKAKIDLHHDDTIVIDLKSTKSVYKPFWMKSVETFGYHRQAAFYSDGLRAIGRPVAAFVHVVVQNSAPFRCLCYKLENRAVQRGRAEYRSALEQIVDCTQSGDWSDPEAAGILEVDFSDWSYRG